MAGINLPLPLQQQAGPMPVAGTTVTANRHEAHADKFPCTKCPSHSASAVDRAAHMRIAHNIEEGFLCHECARSFFDRAQYVSHVNEHGRARFNPPPTSCRSLRCGYQTSSTDVMQRHYGEDHTFDGSHQVQCPLCAFSNDSIVGVSVHMLHVHSAEGIANRRGATRRRRDRDVDAAREAAIEAFRSRSSSSTAEAVDRSSRDRSATTEASSSTSASSPAETVEGSGNSSSSEPAEPATPPRPRTEEEWALIDAHAANSNAFLKQQMAEYNAMTRDEQKQAKSTHKERKKYKTREKKRKARTG